MTKPDEYYAANVLPPIAWALDLYFKQGLRQKDVGVVEVIFPAGDHKVALSKKGNHELAVWLSKQDVLVRARCTYDKSCSFNSDRVDARDRDAVKSLPWDKTEQTRFFKAVRDWLLRLDFDFTTLVRALVTVCDRKVETPLTTKYGKTFDKFDDYRRHKWPEDATPDNRPRLLEEVLFRVAFWFQTAAEVRALK
ncbi:MAG: hypothetical protein C4K49_10480 [Candidatus Thorarchaeota archaeon]|nr:MAG: hypothetical protein C4K49_10480 [Candidatus Thorarchaeota archaeon]